MSRHARTTSLHRPTTSGLQLAQACATREQRQLVFDPQNARGPCPAARWSRARLRARRHSPSFARRPRRAIAESIQATPSIDARSGQQCQKRLRFWFWSVISVVHMLRTSIHDGGCDASEMVAKTSRGSLVPGTLPRAPPSPSVIMPKETGSDGSSDEEQAALAAERRRAIRALPPAELEGARRASPRKDRHPR